MRHTLATPAPASYSLAGEGGGVPLRFTRPYLSQPLAAAVRHTTRKDYSTTSIRTCIGVIDAVVKEHKVAARGRCKPRRPKDVAGLHREPPGAARRDRQI